jgi:hypothetical protein
VRFIVQCPGNAAEVLARARQVLEAVLRNTKEPWPRLEEWRAFLPTWFVERCAPEMAPDAAAARLKLSLDERARLEEHEGWSLGAWLYWLEPDERYWFWWDAAVLDKNSIVVAVEVRDWPFPWESLEWLFRAAGAANVEAEP